MRYYRGWKWACPTGALVAGVFIAQMVGAVPQDGGAQPAQPEWEWPVEVEGPLRTFFEREDVDTVLEGVVRPERGAIASVGELAATFGRDLVAPFRFVQRRIRYSPYPGSLRGAGGTLRSGAGNALDQALLLQALYAASGRSSRLARGRLDWRGAVSLLGEVRAERPDPGDLWLRQVEAISDHWWVQVEDGNRWVDMDPSFPTTGPGDAVAREVETARAVPRRYLAQVEFRLEIDGRTVGITEVPLAELFGHSVRLGLAPPPAPVENDATLDGVDPDPQLMPGELSPEAPIVPDPLDPGPVLAELPVIAEGPVVLVLTGSAGTLLEARVARGQLSRLLLAINIEVPPGRHVRATLPFGDDPRGRLVVAIAGGEVQRGVYANSLTAVYESLLALAEAEVTAFQAWQARPRGNERETLVPPDSAEVTGSLAPVDPEPGAAAAKPLVHPGIALHAEVLRAWRTIETDGLEGLGMALLSAADQLRADRPVEQAAVRLAGINFQPPTGGAPGEITAWIADPARVGGADAERRIALQSALGILQSAVAGQVLNRVADQPPVTAFDVTLRAVGSGSRLSWFRGGRGPDQWPPVAARSAQADLAQGGVLVGPERPLRNADSELLAWWSMAPGSGMASGRVLMPLGVAQAAVTFGPAVELRSLDSVLASLHDVHLAMRWLVSLGDPDRNVLRDLVPGACAATSLVGDLLRAGAPDEFVPPAFQAYCLSAAAS